MNNDNPLSESPDDSFLEASLVALRQIEPPLESRLKNRLAISNALHQQQGAVTAKDARWWRRSISIPIPIAAAVALLLVCATAWNLVRAANSAQQLIATHEPAKGTNFPSLEPAIAYFETGTYLCGIGRLNSEHGYSIQEQKQ